MLNCGKHKLILANRVYELWLEEMTIIYSGVHQDAWGKFHSEIRLGNGSVWI
jgi:hypothetical protein